MSHSHDCLSQLVTMRISLLSWLFFPPLFTILLGINTELAFGQCLDHQRSLLLQFKDSLKLNYSTSAKLVFWNQSRECCRWSGVTCDDAGHVTGIDLNSESIFGGINSSSVLFSFQFLERLNLANNSFGFTDIPHGFGDFTSLTYLNLSNSGFVGQIPIEISSLTKLVILDLSTIYFPGIPTLKLESPDLSRLLQNLGELRELRLDGVNISAQGNEWCHALSSLPNLQVLSLSYCNLSGPIDSQLSKLSFLSVIDLHQNNLSTTVPEFFANFTNLTALRLSSCNLHGTFPQNIFQVPTLQMLDLSENGLIQGFLPEFPKGGLLKTLVLRSTNFSGRLLNSVGNLVMLSRIELSNCSFSGPIPNSISNLTRLVYLDLSSNIFTGSMPSFRMLENLTHIDISRNQLMGQIPSTSFEGLSNLVYIDLRYNSLNGSIPSSLFALSSLQNIQLSFNQFGGQVIEFPNASSTLLDTLDLSSNNLEGPIPMTFFELPRLNILILSSNNFSGTITFEMIYKLHNLTRLDLSYNSLSINTSGGSSSFSSFPMIKRLELASCKLRSFPDLKNQSTLIYLDLSENQIDGTVPNWIWQVGSGTLAYLNLSHNLLVDLQEPYAIPAYIHVLDLHSNQLHGEVPILPESATYVDYSSNMFNTSIPFHIGTDLAFAYFFSLSNNSLNGIIPESICNASYLEVLDLSNNYLSGTIPSCLIEMNTNTLGVLNLRNNKLSGSISGIFPHNCSLETLDLNRNHLEGQVPQSLANCTSLQVLNIGNNEIDDHFPCFLKNSSNLRVLVLRSNRFSGDIHCPGVDHHSWSNLQIIDIASNKFTGDLPNDCFLNLEAMEAERQSELGHLQFGFLNLSNLYYQDMVTVTNKGLEIELVKVLSIFISIDVSNNKFEGKIPDAVGKLKSLVALNLSHNALSGQIPPSLGNLEVLESLDLSYNQLTGQIPIQLTSLTFLSFLNISYNLLVGIIPTGPQFQTFSETSFEGNDGLCGAPLRKNCSELLPSPLSTSVSEFDWQFIITGLGFGVGAAIVVGPVMFWKQGRSWCDERIDKLVLMILPILGLTFCGCDNLKVEAEEDSEGELMHESGASEDDADEGERASPVKYCVFCSKLDTSGKKVVHNPECICHDSPPISSFSSSSSSYS